MNEIEIYGQSDDLIEVVDHISEELYADYGKPTVFTVGEWEIQAEYDGEWSFVVLSHPDGCMWTHLSVGNNDKYNDYTELLRFDVGDNITVTKDE